jgi:hypothetical protein
MNTPPNTIVTPHSNQAIQPSPAPIKETVNFCTQLVNLRLAPIHQFETGDCLVKGGEKKNAGLCNSCKQDRKSVLCYYWKSEGTVCYFGSATPYKHHRSSLLGRVLNYLQNHTKNKNGDSQVNHRVFVGVNNLLKKQKVEFGIFEFDFLTMSDRTLSFAECTEKPDVIVMLEYTLICHFKLFGQAKWNK